MALNPNMANKDVANLLFYTYKDGSPYLSFDRANVTTTGLTSDRTFATGGQGGGRRIGFDDNLGGTLTVETQITPMKLYAMIAGSAIGAKAIKPVREVLKAGEGGAVTVTDTPMANSEIYVYAEDDDCGTALKATVVDKTVTITDGEKDSYYVVYYMVAKETGIQSVRFSTKHFPKAFTVYGDTWYKTEDDEIASLYLTYFKAQPQRSFEVSYSNTGDPGTLSITFDLLEDKNGDVYDMAIEEPADEPDEPDEG